VRRRRFLGVTAGAAGAVGLGAAGCGGVGPGDGEAALRLVAAEYGRGEGVASTRDFWEDVVRKFQRARQDIDVDVSVIEWQDASIEVARLLEADQAPDIAQVSAFSDLAAAEALYPVHELLTIPQQADFVPSLARAGDVGHVQYGMPFASVTWRLYYNRTLFADAGLDPEQPPRDWDELLAAATALKDAGVRVPFGMPLGHDQAYSEAAVWMLSGGGGITDTIGGYAIDSDENVATFTWLRDELVGTGFVGGSDPAVLNRVGIYADFAVGSVGMVFGDSQLMRRAVAAGVEVRADPGTARLPGRDGPVASTLGEAAWVVGLNRGGDREPVSTFLRYVFGSGRATGFASRYELLPVTTQATDEMIASGEPARLLPFLEELPNAAFHPVGKVSWSSVAASISTGIGEALQPGADVAAVLGRLQRRAAAADRAAGV
jgi:multiple sugar transport system substrate-binding protein